VHSIVTNSNDVLQLVADIKCLGQSQPGLVLLNCSHPGWLSQVLFLKPYFHSEAQESGSWRSESCLGLSDGGTWLGWA